MPLARKARGTALDSAVRHWDSVAGDWASARPHRLWRKHSDAVNIELAALLQRHVAPRRLLKTDAFDEAVGDGALWQTLAGGAELAVSVDLSSVTLGGARSTWDGAATSSTGLVADARALPFADASFDCAFSNSTLDHMDSLEEVGAALRELHRVIEPGGWLCLSMDNLDNPLVALRNRLPSPLLQTLGLVPYRMGATCGGAQLRNLVAEVGFEVRAAGTNLHVPRVFAVWAAALLEQRGGPRAETLFLDAARACERAAAWPTHTLTGYFTYVLCQKAASHTISK